MSDEPDPLTVPTGMPLLDQAGSDEPTIPAEVLIITGRSGAGRTQAANALEDLGWYVVDNLPPTLLRPLAGMLTPGGEGVHKLAAVVDVRSRAFFKDLEKVLDELRHAGLPYRIIFLDAADEELVRRFDSSRRPHPLQKDGTTLSGLDEESRVLAPLRDRADEIIDTTSYSIHDLTRHMRDVIAGEANRQVLVTVESFGFKYGMPLDADQVVDVRFLANPYWVSELRHLTGRDQAVFEYVIDQDNARSFAQGYARLIDLAIPGYKRELKPFVTIAVGCTGGRHRSVAMSELIAQDLREKGHQVHVRHRDLGRK
jgi:Predicted P-loop-containing kinase